MSRLVRNAGGPKQNRRQQRTGTGQPGTTRRTPAKRQGGDHLPELTPGKHFTAGEIQTVIDAILATPSSVPGRPITHEEAHWIDDAISIADLDDTATSMLMTMLNRLPNLLAPPAGIQAPRYQSWPKLGPDQSELHYHHLYPRAVDKERIRVLIQRMIDESHGLGFRELADHDVCHGHIIFSNKRARRPKYERAQPVWENHKRHVPAAILYHTQEYAHDAERCGAFQHGYTDPERRNWLQNWADGSILDLHDHPELLLPGEQPNDHHTVFDSQVDLDQLEQQTNREILTHTYISANGESRATATTWQFNFHPIAADDYDSERTDHIEVQLGGQPVYLQLTGRRDIDNAFEGIPSLDLQNWP